MSRAWLLPVLLLFCSCAHSSPERGVIFSRLMDRQTSLAYIEADPESGWYAASIENQGDMAALAGRLKSGHGLIIPVFPTVYSPSGPLAEDIGYYNYLLRDSGLKQGDKVLVVGSGSGADSWVAWLKTGGDIHAVDINPLAAANTKATAGLAGFSVSVLTGDINDIEFPEGFSDFDFVLWNMPFLAPGGYRENLYHDNDTGQVLLKFLARLPSLLKPSGRAVLLNTPEALEMIRREYPEVLVFPPGKGTRSQVMVIVRGDGK